MALFQDRDSETTRESLAGWLAKRMPQARDLRVSGILAPPSNGFSNETLLFDARWSEDGENRSQGLVARIKSRGYAIFPEYDIERQSRVMEVLGARTKIPVPRIYGYEADDSILGAPFFVMERIDGEIPEDAPPYHIGGWMTERSPAERARLWWSGIEAMALIHKVDWRSLGFEDLDTKGSGATPLDRQLGYYERYLAWATSGKRHAVAESAFAWLKEHRPIGDEPVHLCWGDSRLGNMIFRDSRCVAVLDWEMATLGNPEQDLAWWLFFDRHHSEGCDAPRLPGLPDRDETLARYRELTGLSTDRLDYYEVFAAFRFSAIMIRVGQSLVASGILPADSDFETNNTATKLLEKLLR